MNKSSLIKNLSKLSKTSVTQNEDVKVKTKTQSNSRHTLYAKEDELVELEDDNRDKSESEWFYQTPGQVNKKIDRNAKLPCEICNKNIAYSNMSKHVKKQHSAKTMKPKIKVKRLKKKGQKCDKCTYSTNRRADLLRHVDATHESSIKIIKNKFRKFGTVTQSIVDIFSELNEILNSSPGDEGIKICLKKWVSVGPQIKFLIKYTEDKNNFHLGKRLDDIKGEAAAIAIKMSEVCAQLVDSQDEKKDNRDEATEGDDGMEILELGILNETFIIDTNVFMHFPNEVQHIFANTTIELALPYRVLAELDTLKKSNVRKTRLQATEAQKFVTQSWDRFKYKQDLVSFIEFSTKVMNHDDQILIYAKSLKAKCIPIIMTHDYNFQLRIRASKVKTLTPQEYKQKYFIPPENFM